MLSDFKIPIVRHGFYGMELNFPKSLPHIEARASDDKSCGDYWVYCENSNSTGLPIMPWDDYRYIDKAKQAVKDFFKECCIKEEGNIILLENVVKEYHKYCFSLNRYIFPQPNIFLREFNSLLKAMEMLSSVRKTIGEDRTILYNNIRFEATYEYNNTRYIAMKEWWEIAYENRKPK